jgi:hypothetical protein
MITKYLSLAAAGMLVSSMALAQTSETSKMGDTSKMGAAQTETGSVAASDNAMVKQTHAQKESLRQDMTQTLQQAGFTNVRVMPDSFLVQAKDKSGHPVAMIINPNSMTEIVDEGTLGQTASAATQGNAADEQSAAAETSGETGGLFTQVPKQEKLSSNVVGMNVYNGQNQDIGTIKDIAYGPRGVKAYIIGVGGFLGVGDHYVAVQPSAVNFTYDHANNQWKADVNATADQLKQAPAYTYPNQG